MKPEDKEIYARSFAVHVGVDTAKHFHVLVARGPDWRRLSPQRVEVSRAGFEGADRYLMETFSEVPRQKILVALKFAGHHGHTFAAFLVERGYTVVSVLPSTTKKSKEMEDNSPLKSDAKDAALICKLVGEGKFVSFTHLESPFTELRVLAMQRHRLSGEGVRFRNRLKAALDLAWPEFAQAFTTLAAPTPLALLQRWPLPADLAAASPRSVRALIRKVSRNQYAAEKVEKLLESARTSIALSQASGARRRELWDLLARWSLVREQMAEVDERIEQVVMGYPPARALTTIPELGPVGAATLLSELGALEDYEHPRQVLKLAGMNLVASDSGSRTGRRYQSKRGRPLLRKQIFLLATRWCKKRGLFRAQYEAMVKRNGGSKIKAISALARKLVPLLLEIAQSARPFDYGRWWKDRRIRAA